MSGGSCRADPLSAARRYLDGMGSGMLTGMRAVILGWAVVGLIAVSGCGSPALLATQFADVYAAFAPLYALHRSYADHLFAGTPVDPPPGLSEACENYTYRLAVFHAEYVVQTASVTAAGIAHVVRLRAASAAFCEDFARVLQAIEASSADPETLTAAGEKGLYAEIKRVNDRLEATLDELLVGSGNGVERWAFAVTFSMRTILRQPGLERISADLREILYADPEGTAPPSVVPEAVAEAMERLLGLSGRRLSEAESGEAIEAAAAIYDHFMERW